jgi:septal ring factor EnvC (AmiA/AmiB activator)
MLNWRRDPAIENEIVQIESLINASRNRTKQLENEIELLRSESAQIERETAQLSTENARLAELNAKIDALWPSSTFSSTQAMPPAADSPT